MQRVKNEVLMVIENTLRDELTGTLTNSQQDDNHEMMVEGFDSFDRNIEQRFKSMLEEGNEESAKRVKALMFTFDVSQKLDPSGIQTLPRGVGKN